MLASHSTTAAVVGLLFALPLAILNAIVGNQVEPFFSFIRPGVHTAPREYVAIFTVLFLLPVGAFIAVRPLFRKSADGQRRFYALNGAVGALLIVAFVAVSIGLGADIYRCDILQVANCD